MILIELIFGMVLAAFVLVMLPLILFMLGVAGAVLLWIVAPAALLGVLFFWLLFANGHGLALLAIVLIIGLFLVERRSPRAY
jgi:hypothetical protein